VRATKTFVHLTDEHIRFERHGRLCGHALNLGYEDEEIYAHIEDALAEVSRNDISADELTALVLKVGSFGVKAMALLDKANTSTYGNPELPK
jgi:hydroxylamine reductase